MLFSVLEEGEISLDMSREFCLNANAYLVILLDVIHEGSRNELAFIQSDL